jgi:preprotein translocase subunit SecD
MSMRNRLLIFVGSIIISVLALLPTLTQGTLHAKNWISKPLGLGLDLSGGVHLGYEVQSDEAVVSRFQSTLNSIRAALRDDKVAVVKAKVNGSDNFEFTILTPSLAEKVQQKIENDFKEVSILQKGDDAGKYKFVLGINDVQKERIKNEAINQAIETLRERVDQFGVAEPLIQKVGENRILLQMPGISDVEAVKKLVGSVAKLEFRLVPVAGSNVSTITLKDRSGAPLTLEDEVLMTGDSVQDSTVDMISGRVEVHLKLTPEGRRTFGRITRENVDRQLAIILDGVVYSHPNIDEPITTGDARITGGFSMDEGRQLKIVLKAGALPASLKVMEERTVGPTLGSESIRKGILAIIVGFVAIIIFMLIYYRKAGVIAVASLILNLLLMVGMLGLFGATLTLPGLAALALTIGMAVDSNVIIFERIKDELRTGASRDAAVSSGFEKALSAIVDSNMSHLLTGIILYILGTGSIRGFAVTLCVGILTTLFCATFASRLGFDFFELKGRDGKISI